MVEGNMGKFESQIILF